MRSAVLLSALVCAVAFITACSRSDAATSRSGASAAELGVPECDTYTRKYVTCIDDKAPKEVKDAMKAALEQQKAAWKQAASTDAGKKALAAACKQADDSARAGMTAYGCQW